MEILLRRWASSALAYNAVDIFELAFFDLKSSITSIAQRISRISTDAPAAALNSKRRSLLVQDNREQRLVNFDFPVVFDKAHLPELVHEQIHPSAGCADHFRQHFLRDFLNYCLGLVFSSIASEQQQSAGQSLLSRVEELIDQVGLDCSLLAYKL